LSTASLRLIQEPSSRSRVPFVKDIMRPASRIPTSTSFRSVGRRLFVTAFLASFASMTAESQAQSAPGPLVSRAELTAAATQAEAAATTGDPAKRAQNALSAAVIRQRLRDGDLQVGDRVVVTIISDAVHRDTVVVRSGRSLELPGMIVVPVAGVLRSELQERVSTEVRKYVKAQEVEVMPLMRVGVLGAVARPGYFAFASDIPLTDAIMGAGGPTGAADVGRSSVRRRNQEYRSAGETSKAIASGLTLDQFGLSAGDELVVGQRRELGVSTLFGVTGALASVLALVVAMRR
jgi:hypothetical protein